jgi:LacI family transcriptional regulator
VGGETRYIRSETRERVQRAVADLGFYPNQQASALRGGRTYVIALILSDIANPFWPAFARGVQRIARLEGYQVVLANSDWELEIELEYLAMARRARFDGIIINPGELTNAELLQTQIPAVIAGSTIEFTDFDIVTSDTAQGMLESLRYVQELGHERIAFVGLETRHPIGQVRLAEFRTALRTAGLAERPEFITEASYLPAGGRAAAATLLSQPDRPTAILTSNDEQAIGVLAEAQARGLHVPHDLSIVGIDDIEAAAITTPPLTTLHVDRQVLGEIAMRFLIERIEGYGPSIFRRRLEPCTLVTRGSTAPPRHSVSSEDQLVVRR